MAEIEVGQSISTTFEHLTLRPSPDPLQAQTELRSLKSQLPESYHSYVFKAGRVLVTNMESQRRSHKLTDVGKSELRRCILECGGLGVEVGVVFLIN